MMDQFQKTAGAALFFGNRTKPSPSYQDHEFTPRCVTPNTGVIVNLVHRYKKTDITINKGSNLKSDGGYVIASGLTPIAYESIELGTGAPGSGIRGDAFIRIASGLFQHLDKITIGNKSIEIRTDNSGDNQTKWNIPASPLSSQISTLVSMLGSTSFGAVYLPSSQVLNFIAGADYIQIQARTLDTTANGIAVGVTSANNQISVTDAKAAPVKAETTIGNVKFKALVAGSAGNNISIGFSTGAATSTPECSQNQANVIDIKIQSGVTTFQEIVNAVTAQSTVNTTITAELVGTGSTTATAPIAVRSLDGGSAFTIKDWQPGDKLKNCFIPAPKVMYGYNTTSADSRSVNETYIPANTTLYQAYHALQLIAHPNFNYGAWFRKNVAKQASVRVLPSVSYPNPYNYVELEMLPAIAGTAGNQYTFEVRNGEFYQQMNKPATSHKMFLENNGKRIVLQLGTNGSNPSDNSTISTIGQLIQACLNGNPAILNMVKFNFMAPGVGINYAIPETAFSGGTDVAGVDTIKDGSIDFIHGRCAATVYSGFGATGEIGVDGKSRIVDDLGGVIRTSGKMGGLFARVVPAGTPIKAIGYIGDLEIKAIAGGTAGNSLGIKYVSGGTAGSETVSVAGGVISVTIQDTVTTAEQVRAALSASSQSNTLVTARIIGTPSNPQSSAMSPSAIMLKNGSAGLANDAGFFMCPRKNIQQADTNLVNVSQMGWELWFSKNLSDPASFQLVTWFEDGNIGDTSAAGNRYIFELNDFNDVGGAGVQFTMYNANQSFNTISFTRKVYYRNAYITDGPGVIYEAVAVGSAGNKSYDLKVQAGATVGNETATLSGNLITLTIAPGQSSIAQIKTAIANSPAVAAVLTMRAQSGYNDATIVGQTFNAKPLMGGVDAWQNDGLWGFGYCNINETDVLPTTNTLYAYNTTLRKSPRGNPNEIMIDQFRLTKIV